MVSFYAINSMPSLLEHGRFTLNVEHLLWGCLFASSHFGVGGLVVEHNLAPIPSIR